MSKNCKACGLSEPEVNFGWRTVGGRKYLKIWCRGCERKREKLQPGYKSRRAKYDKKNQEKNRIARQDPESFYKFIYADARNSDRKFGRDNDLDRESIRMIVNKPCTYCLLSNLRMTLDRVDNSLGHTKNNVIAACVRCNYLRRDMPYEAWMRIVPAIRLAAAEGLFGDWTGSIHKHKSLSLSSSPV